MLLPVLLVIAVVLTLTDAFAHDLTKLPLGDNLKSDAPKVGWLWPCRVEPEAGGAQVLGPWIKPDATFDKTAKPIVPGNARWKRQMTMALIGGEREFIFNALPDHGTGDFPIKPGTAAYAYDTNPNSIREKNLIIRLPARPELLPQPMCAPGAIGILLSGAVLFSGLDAPGRDAVAHEIQDGCDGHPQPSGIYHYHNLSACAEGAAKKEEHSPLAGYAIDGFGIYGRHGEGGKKLTNSNLDVCHGHSHEIVWDGTATSMYHYHATDEFPYVAGCLRGKFTRGNVEILAGPPPR
ncbi:MAG: YHYH protein [Rhizobiaceae bacterium]